MTAVLSPALIFFSVVIIGLLLGHIRIYSISLDVSAVLIAAIAMGFLLSQYLPSVFDAQFKTAMSQYSKLGTALFVAVIGISAGASVDSRNIRKALICLVAGASTVFVGFVAAAVIRAIDRSADISLLLGILCGALTSTPGLACVCDMRNIDPSVASAGYGAAYLFGVIGVVLFVQVFLRKAEKLKSRKAAFVGLKNCRTDGLLIIAAAAVIGTALGGLKIPIINLSVGTAGGILIAGIICGILAAKFLNFKKGINSLAVYRNFGLMLFFVGNGISAGENLNMLSDVKWFAYGALITVSCILAGDVFGSLIFKKNTVAKLSVIAGGMTSTPAYGVILRKTENVDTTAYSFTYLGALFGVVFGLCIFNIVRFIICVA